MGVKTGLIAVALLFGSAPVAATPARPAPVRVMVLGAYHFGNPGRDVNNVKVDSVLTPQRQRELDALATALLRFRPSHVAVEMESERGDLHASAYDAFTPAALQSDANEVTQIGFRIAHRAGHKSVYAIDEQPGPGEPDYFPFEAVQAAAKKNGQQSVLDALLAEGKAASRRFEQEQAKRTIAQSLMVMNGPAFEAEDRRFSFGIIGIGDRNVQAGADLAGMWFLRNAKIFGKLMSVAKAGDRIIIVIGAGHGYWLRQMVRETPGYQLEDVMPYLKRVKL